MYTGLRLNEICQLYVSDIITLDEQLIGSGQSTPIMLSVLKLFIIPVGGGIPAGVLLAHAKGLAWPLTTILYLVSE